MPNRRERLHSLLDLARAYRGWSRVQLARALNRDTTRLYSETEDPKFSFVVSLADVLEWPMDAITEYLWTGELDPAPEQMPDEYLGLSFEELYPLAQDAYKRGEYSSAVSMARWLLEIARTARQRSESYNMEFLGWDGLGRYTKAANAIRKAMLQTPIDAHMRSVLHLNLANTQYTLWDLAAAIGICTTQIQTYDSNPPTDLKGNVCRSHAHYVRGNALRRSANIETDRADEYLTTARKDLQYAMTTLNRLAVEYERDDLRGTAHTCEGALLEVGVMLGELKVQPTLDQMMDRLEAVTDPTKVPKGAWLESFGWWCVFGGNIALKFMEVPELQRPMAVFINKALEIAERSGNWAFRERVLTMEHMLRESITDSTGFVVVPTIDDEDVRNIAGTMGRFPCFQRLGWQILKAAKVEKHGRRH